MNSNTASPRTVVGTIHYVKRVDEPLYSYDAIEPPAGVKPTNHVADGHEFEIESARDLPGGADIEVQGFELVRFEPAIGDIYDKQQRTEYFDPAVAKLVKRRTGAVETRLFSTILRGEEAQRRAPGSISAPAGTVHIDFTPESGPFWFDQLLGADAGRLRGRRFAIINVWRPITGPLKDHPLALCDARTIAPEELTVSTSITRIGKDGLYSAEGELSKTDVYYPAYNAKHRWYYVPDMRPDEALLLKNYDSATDGMTRCSAHSAFKDPTAPADVLPRASIEVRVLTVW